MSISFRDDGWHVTAAYDDVIDAQADEQAEELGVLSGSKTRGRGNKHGMIGEIVSASYYNAKIIKSFPQAYDYDLYVDGLRVDVKTKSTNVTTVKPFYEASVLDENPSQDCDAYLFCRVNLTERTCWLCGWLPRDEFFRQARFLKKGDVTGSNNFVVRHDRYNVNYDETHPPQTMKNWREMLD